MNEIEGIRVLDTKPDTNIVFFDVSQLGLDKGMFLILLQEHGVKMGAVGQSIRAVAHLDVSRADIDFAVDTVSKVAKFLGSAVLKAERRDICKLENVVNLYSNNR